MSEGVNPLSHHHPIVLMEMRADKLLVKMSNDKIEKFTPRVKTALSTCQEIFGGEGFEAMFWFSPTLWLQYSEVC